MTKIIGIPRMIGMTGDWDAKKTRMSNHGQKSLEQ